MSRRSDEYFATLDGDKTAGLLLKKAFKWFNNLDSNGYMDKIREMWAAYHGAYYSDIDDGHRISFGGEQGELANLPVNHLRNISQHIIVMLTADRPAMQARAINTDYKSQVQTILANGLLDYYMRDKRLEKYLKTAVEYAIVLGAGFIKMEWNATSGELYDYNEDTETPIYEGDVQFTNLSPFDVVYDSTTESQMDHDWVLIRSFKNRFDLAAKYPEMKDKILALHTKDEIERFRFNSLGYDETDLIPMYEFYHKRTESVPDGRYLLFLDDEIILQDSPMPYRDLPVYRIVAGEILGTPYGYTPMFDILPIQDAINMLYSTVLSNQNAFGVQNIMMPRGTDVNPVSLVGGLNIIEYNAQLGKPEAMQLTNTPKEVFDFMDKLERTAETISGVSSVSRGNPEKSLNSGNALALIQSMSIQFMSGLQQSYVQMIEDVGSGLIQMLKDFAAVPRVAMITGKSNRTYMKEFTGDDLSSVNRIIVDVGNPLSRTTAGRVQMAEQMLQMGIIKTAEQYFTVLNTGNLDSMTEDTQSELMLIKAENESLISKEEIYAVATEQHSLHIKEHKSVLADPDLKRDPDLVERTLFHIQEHINLLRTTDPDMLMMMGEQPLGPPGGSPAAQPVPEQQVNVTGMEPAVGPPIASQQAPSGSNPNASLPQPATPPAPFDKLPTDAGEALPQG